MLSKNQKYLTTSYNPFLLHSGVLSSFSIYVWCVYISSIYITQKIIPEHMVIGCKRKRVRDDVCGHNFRTI